MLSISWVTWASLQGKILRRAVENKIYNRRYIRAILSKLIDEEESIAVKKSPKKLSWFLVRELSTDKKKSLKFIE